MTTTAQHPIRRTAFTLIEMLTVMAIIILLATIVLQVAKHAKLKAQTTKAQSDIQQYMSECTKRRADEGRYPDSLSVGVDPWNHAYRYRLYTYPEDMEDPTTALTDELQYIIGSFGPDGAPGLKGIDDDTAEGAANIYFVKWPARIAGADNTQWSEFGYGDDIVRGEAPMYKRFYP